jgi:D-arabinose 1-dehydrogenase-like Zn-dependent alcohol dehydrogenase
MRGTIQKGYANTDFGQIHNRRVSGPGLPIVLLHRTPASSSSFEAMLRHMAGLRTAIALDTPGFGGNVALIGALAGFGGDIPAAALVMGALRASAIVVGSQAEHRALTNFMGEHHVRPVIDSIFKANAAAAAYTHADAGAFGKVVIRLY